MKTVRELMGLEEADKMKGEDPCWDTHQMVGMKMKNGRKVPNCVPKAKPKNEEVEIAEAKVGDTVSFHHELKSAPGSKVKKSGTVEKVDGDVVHVKVKDKYGVKRHQIKMGDLVKEETEMEEASDTKRPPNFTMYPIDRQDYKILRPPKKTPPKSGKEWGRDGGEKKLKEETEQIEEGGIIKSIKRALHGWDKNAVGPGGEKLGNPRDIVRRAKAMDTDTAKKVRAGLNGASEHSPAGLQKRVLDRKLKNVKEETEQIDELNKDTVYSYNKKADADIEKKHKSLGQLMRRGDAAGANKAAHQINRRLAGMERAEKRLNNEEVEQIDEISAEVKQKYLAAATKKHLQQFLGRAPVRDKQELDKRRAAIQKTSKELTGKTHYQEEVEESKKNPASDKPVDPKDLVVSLKDVPVKKPRGTGKYKPEQDFPGVKALKREETELEEAEAKKVRMTPQERAYKRKLGLKAVLKPVAEAAKVETAAQVTKHFEKGQSTPSGVPKWVAEPVDNPKLADKFMKAFRKMKTAANVSCKTYGTVSTCEETELDEAAKAKMKGDPSQSKNVKKGEPLSGKQEPINVNPVLQEK